MSGTRGGDTIIGSSSDHRFWNDTIIGGAGNDLLRGGHGNDLYIWNRGDGNDTIDEMAWQGHDTLQLGPGVTAAQVRVVSVGDDLQLVIASSSATARDGATILLPRQVLANYEGIDTVRFADGTVWGFDDLRARALTWTGTAGSDTIDGHSTHHWFWNDTIIGGAGNYLLRGGNGDDLYIWNRGDGNDTIDETAWQGHDTLQLGPGVTAAQVRVVRVGDDLQLVIAPSSATAQDGATILLPRQVLANYEGIDTVRFADGTVWGFDDLRALALTLTGTAGADTIQGHSGPDWFRNDTITGGAGNDLLRGGNGDDVYVWNRGHGNDTIDETAWQGWDTLQLGVLWTDARLQRSGNDLLIVVARSAPSSNNGGTLTIKDYFLGDHRGVDVLRWSDGLVWDRSGIDFMAGCVWGTEGNDVLTGTDGNDSIIGHLGNDRINGGRGDDILSGGAGNDTIEGGAGNDLLWGISGNDVFVFRPGFGRDRIEDFAAGSGVVDVIELSRGLAADFAGVLARAADVGNDCVITFDANTAITLVNVKRGQLVADDFRFV